MDSGNFLHSFTITIKPLSLTHHLSQLFLHVGSTGQLYSYCSVAQWECHEWLKKDNDSEITVEVCEDSLESVVVLHVGLADSPVSWLVHSYHPTNRSTHKLHTCVIMHAPTHCYKCFHPISDYFLDINWIVGSVCSAEFNIWSTRTLWGMCAD